MLFKTELVVRLAGGKSIEATYCLLGCKLDLVGQEFDADLPSAFFDGFDAVAVEIDYLDIAWIYPVERKFCITLYYEVSEWCKG